MMAAMFFHGHGIFLALAFCCVSLLVTSDGYIHDKLKRTSNKNKPSHEIKKYCRGMKWLKKYQRNICYRSPEIIEVIQNGVELALKECRRQFGSYRWNCSPLSWKQVFIEDGILKKRSRETAFVQALTAASVMMEIAKICGMKKLKYCGCGALSRRHKNDMSAFSVCGDNVNFGAYLASTFMDPKRSKTHAKKAKRHNHITGRKIVRQNIKVYCECNSVFGTCKYKICRRMVPTIDEVGDEIWKLYQKPIRSYWNKTDKELQYKKKKALGKTTTTDSEKLQGKLVYFKRSENFCEPNFPMGIMGTRGRACNHTSSGPDGCDALCCGRSCKTNVFIEEVKCNCRFVWCCDIKCDKCTQKRVVNTCE